ncbi:hypothetical protein KSS87_000446, partial [Heliosperma pusillum]
ILSPFTKEYRVLAAFQWHTLIFGGSSEKELPTILVKIKLFLLKKDRYVHTYKLQ